MSILSTRGPSIFRFIGHAVFGIVTVVGAFWVWGALSVQLSKTPYNIAISVLILTTIIAIALRFRARRLGWICFFLAAAIVALWYQSVKPSNQRDWAFDVAHGVGASLDGDIVTLSNVRNFVWSDENTAEEFWENRTLDLSELQSVDMFTSVWDNPNIAHLLISFGFADGQRVAFSVETRKESHEEFNIRGGFFRQFEIVLLAATEEDIVKVRTNHRQEDVRIYPVDLSRKQRRDLFLSYVQLAQDLEEQPKFYNTLTANCTTIVFSLARVIKPGMSLDWRLILSGHLPELVDKLGGFKDGISIEQRIKAAGITEKAAAYVGPDYSAAIRK